MIVRHQHRYSSHLGLLLASGALFMAACTDQVGPAQLIAPGDSDGTTTAVADGSGTANDPAPATADVAVSARSGSWTSVDFTLETVANVAQPTGLAFRPGDDDLWLIERAGRVRLLERTLDPEALTESLNLVGEPVIDLTRQITTKGEGGLLGIAFAPDGKRLYLNYTDRNGDTVVSEFTMGSDPTEFGEERVLLQVPQPFINHNGGDLAFGPDGLLYISLGDGGASGDPDENGQDRTTLLGTILRIDPTPGADTAYTIPETNPFVDGVDGFRPEIWSWGLRNPWRMSFDTGTGDLWIADVGQADIEEINRLPFDEAGAGRGANLGWNLREGSRPFAGEEPTGHVPPIHEYDHNDRRCSVTGGYVYRAPTMPALDGVYLYADFCTPGIAGIQIGNDGSTTVAEVPLSPRPEQVISFGQGPRGELYVMEAAGAVSRVQVPDWPWTITRAAG